MSDVNEEYQDQVLEDLSDIKESVTTDSGYQEKVLDNLDDIKESVSEEQDYYDKEYQKKVLGNLRNIQKSVEDLNVDYESINLLFSGNTQSRLTAFYQSSTDVIKTVNGVVGVDFYAYDIFNTTDLYLTISTVNNNSGLSHEAFKSKCFFTDVNPETIFNSSNDSTFSISGYELFTSPVDKYLVHNKSDNTYLIVTGYNTTGVNLYRIAVGDTSNDVTSGSAVIADGIDTLIQITTFQGFASALLTGILLFLVFVKGLRR